MIPLSRTSLDPADCPSVDKGFQHEGDGRGASRFVFKLEGKAFVAGGAEEGAVVGGTEDFNEHLLMGADPFDGRECAYCAVETFARNSLLLYKHENTGDEALEKMEEVGDGSDSMAHAGEDSAVEDHLPLDTTVGAEE